MFCLFVVVVVVVFSIISFLLFQQKSASTPVPRQTEFESWNQRVSASFEGITPYRHGNEAGAGAGRKGGSQWKNKNSTGNGFFGKDMNVGELKGRGKKEQGGWKRKWKEGKMEGSGPKWPKGLSTPNEKPFPRGPGDGKDPNGSWPAAKKMKRMIQSGHPVTSVKRGVVGSKNEFFGDSSFSSNKAKNARKKQRNEKQFNQKNVRNNRGFKSSATAKSFDIIGYL